MAEKRTDRRTVELTDPRALRALAHPTRLRLVGLLRREGALTATQAGERLSESPASCSFHLRQLAKWGLVEEAGGGRGRERPWRATARSTTWAVRSAADAVPAAALGGMIAEQWVVDLLAWFERLPAEARQWQEAHQLADTTLELTPAQLDELGRRVWELVTSYERERPRPGAREVTIVFAGYPRP